jgi:periplasmic divalent cation tolerance protein
MSENLPPKPHKLLVVVTSLPDLDAARGLARSLVEKNLAACVQLMDGIQSIYHWEGKICEEHEVVLSAKTTDSKWFEISAFIQNAHPYDLPEILAFSPEQYEQQYGKWVESEVNSKA